MAQFFPIQASPRWQGFQEGLLHTQEGQSQVFAGANALSSTTPATVTVSVAATGAGLASVQFVPATTSILPALTTVTTITTGTDTVSSTALKLANAIRASVVGLFYSVSVAVGVITMTANNSGSAYNLTASNGAGLLGNTLAFANTVAVDNTTRLVPGRFVQYNSATFASQNNRSIVEVLPVSVITQVAGIVQWTPEAVLSDDNSFGYLPTTAAPIISGGIVSLAPVGAAITLGGSVFLSLSGVNQGRIAASNVDGTFSQINVLGQPFTLRPVSGATSHGGFSSQKFRLAQV